MQLEGFAGNPGVEPVRPNNFSITVDGRVEDADFRATVFYKHVTGLVQVRPQAFYFASLVTRDVTPLPASGSTTGVLVRPENSGSAHVRGYELGGGLPLAMLTPNLSDFWVFGNYARARSNVQVPGLLDMSANLGLEFKKGGFLFSVARSFRGEGSFEQIDPFGGHKVVSLASESATDVRLGYRVRSGAAKGLTVTFTVQNLGRDKGSFSSQYLPAGLGSTTTGVVNNSQRWDLRVAYAL